MPITACRKPENKLIIITHSGAIPDNEFLEFYRGFFQSDTFDPAVKLLIDLREADSRSRSSSTLRQFADFVQKHINNPPTPPKVAVVAPKSLSFGLARMYQSFADSVPWEFVVFRAVDAALAWLDVPEDLMDCSDKAEPQSEQ